MKHKAEIITLTSIGLVITFLVSWYVIPYLHYSSSPSWSYFVRANNGTTVKMSEDGNYIALKHINDLYLFHKNSPIPLWIYQSGQDIYSVDISRDGNHLVIATDFGVAFFNRTQSIPIWSSGFSTFEIYYVAISSNGSYIIASNDNRFYLFNKSSSTPIWSCVHGDLGSRVAISKDGNTIAATTNVNRLLFNKSSPYPMWNASIGYVRSLAISADGTYIIALNSADQVYLFNRSSSIPVWSYDMGDSSFFGSLSISSDGSIIAISSGIEMIYIFNNTHPFPLYNYTLKFVYDIALTPDGQFFALVTSKTIYLYQTFTPNPICSYSPIDATLLSSVQISSDGNYIGATGWATLALFDRRYPYMANEFDFWSYTNLIVFSICLSLMSFIIGQYGNYITKKKKKETDKKNQKTNKDEIIKIEKEREEEIKRFKDRFKELEQEK